MSLRQAIVIAVFVASALLGAFVVQRWRQRELAVVGVPLTSDARVEQFCSSCHRLPPPDTLPRSHWEAKVKDMFALVDAPLSPPIATLPAVDAVVRYYTERAPEELPLLEATAPGGRDALEYERIPLKLRDVRPFPAAANVKFVRLFDEKHLDLLVCEMRFGLILVMQPYLQLAQTLLLGKVPHPCHAEVVDLDQDGHRDVLVADLGTVTPSDVRKGSIVWMRGSKTAGFKSIPLAAGLGRVADVQAADFDGDGDLDLVAAVFGWRKVGEVLYLENQTTDYSAPNFQPYVLDSRPGAIHVPVTDLNGDGRPDFVALISQHFETVEAFISIGRGRFEKKTIFEARHPGWGSSSIELVDLDGDRDLDVLLANGDTLDDLVLKPYHGITWLENQGQFPFQAHSLTHLYGVHRARTGDLDGDADLDIAACVYLPFVKADHPQVSRVDSIIWLEQTHPGRFVRHALETATPVHPTLDVADFDADGDDDIAVGNMTMAKGEKDTLENWVLLLKSLRR